MVAQKSFIQTYYYITTLDLISFIYIQFTSYKYIFQLPTHIKSLPLLQPSTPSILSLSSHSGICDGSKEVEDVVAKEFFDVKSNAGQSRFFFFFFGGVLARAQSCKARIRQERFPQPTRQDKFETISLPFRVRLAEMVKKLKDRK